MTALRRKALFLDRDGVINVDHGYVHRPDQFEFCPGIFGLVAHARRAGYVIVVVTNQAGIGRGYYGLDDFQRLSDWMQARFAEQGAPIDRVYFCPDHPEHGLGDYRRDSALRKPNPGMLLLAAEELQLDLSASVMVGDHETDIQAGRRAGVALTLLVNLSGRTVGHTDADAVVRALDDILPYLDGRESRHPS